MTAELDPTQRAAVQAAVLAHRALVRSGEVAEHAARLRRLAVLGALEAGVPAATLARHLGVHRSLVTRLRRG